MPKRWIGQVPVDGAEEHQQHVPELWCRFQQVASGGREYTAVKSNLDFRLVRAD